MIQVKECGLRADYTESRLIKKEACAISCRQCWSAARSNLLEGLSPAAVDVLESSRQTRNYRKGELVTRQGLPVAGLFCVSSGLLKVSHTDAEGAVHILRLVGPGEFVGLRSLLWKRPVNATAESLVASVVCELSAEAVQRALQMDARLDHNFLRALTENLDRTESRLLSQLTQSSPVRVAELLLRCADASGALAPLSVAEISQLTGTRSESVSRLIRTFLRKGMLERRGSGLSLTDPGRMTCFVSRMFCRTEKKEPGSS